MQAFGVDNNNLNGGIPLALFRNWTDLMVFSIANNTFTGSIPPEISRWEYLEFLILSGNCFNGTIRADLGGSLHMLNLSNNYLTGMIPSGFGNLSSLQLLDLSSNHFEGELPASFTLFSCPATDSQASSTRLFDSNLV